MIIDSHLHIWRSDPEYPEQAATTVSPASDVPLELLKQYMAEFGVDRAVMVQPIYPAEDNSYVAGCAASSPDRFAAVCVVDPRNSGAVSRLRYWVQEQGCRGLRLRPIVAAEAACFGEASTFPIWEFAAETNLVISVLGNFDHLDALMKLAQRFSTVPIVVDHLAHPPDPNPQACEPLLSLSKCPNVVMKISGFASYSHEVYPYRDCIQLVRTIYERFGPQRMIWGSDFPHVLLESGYARALRWIERTCEFLDESDRTLILGENAYRLYWDQAAGA